MARPVENLEQAIFLSDDPKIRLELVKVLIESDDYDRAIAEIDRLIEDCPTNAKIRYYRGYAQLQRGDLASARADFEACLAIKPGDPEGFYGLGLVDHAEGRFDDAIARFDEAHEAAPRFGRVLTGRGKARLARGDLDGAERDLNEAIDTYRPFRIVPCVSWGSMRNPVYDRPYLDFLRARADRPDLRFCITLRCGSAAVGTGIVGPLVRVEPRRGRAG